MNQANQLNAGNHRGDAADILMTSTQNMVGAWQANKVKKLIAIFNENEIP
jgi:hypothetical protein